MQTLYKWWAGLMLVAVVLQVGFAGYGAFFVGGKLDGDGKTIDEDTFMDGFGIHSGFGYLVWLLGLVFLLIGVAAGIGKWRLGRHGVLFGSADAAGAPRLDRLRGRGGRLLPPGQRAAHLRPHPLDRERHVAGQGGDSGARACLRSPSELHGRAVRGRR